MTDPNRNEPTPSPRSSRIEAGRDDGDLPLAMEER